MLRNTMDVLLPERFDHRIVINSNTNNENMHEYHTEVTGRQEFYTAERTLNLLDKSR